MIIRTFPKLSEKEIDDDYKLCELVFIFYCEMKVKKSIKIFLDKYENTDNEKIVWIHSYPKEKQFFVGVDRLDKSNYFI